VTRIDSRFLTDAGPQIFTGNELLVKGALETEGGVHLVTGYPGSPIAGVFDTLGELGPLLNEKGIVANMANNEALSVAMVNGAQMAGCRAITVFKSVGLHVAADALALGVLASTHDDGGGLIIIGDDPWSESTQVPADSRFLAEHLRLPIIEPACPQEVKDWVSLGFKLGQAGRMYIGYICTTAMADGGGTVNCRPNQYPSLNEHQRKALSYEHDIEPALDTTVLLPPRTWWQETGLAKRHAAVKAEARRLGINRILHRPQKDEVVPLGFIASGGGYAYLAHALAELGLSGKLPICKLGLAYPVDEQIVTEFARQCEMIVVVEERRSFVERQVIEILNPFRQTGELSVEIYGKRFPDLRDRALRQTVPGLPETRGLNPSIVIEHLVPLLRNIPTLPIELTNGRLTAELDRIQSTATYDVKIPLRTATFCAGCPHRDSTSVLLELRRDLLDPQYMLAHHQRKPVDLVAHGDTGCYTMLMFEPTKPLMHNYSGMGLGGGTGAGVDPFIDNKQLVFMGDGTFFHSGQIAIGQSINTGQDITYIILDNGTTAMTGHQVNPGNEVDLRGNPVFAMDIERIVSAMIPKKLAKDVRVVRIDPADRPRYRRLLEQTILADGVKIVIADKECGITFHRRVKSDERQTLKQLGYLPQKTHMNVATEVCEYCLECTNQTGCPGLTVVESDYGPKIQTDFSWCVDDGACQKIGACPAFEQVTILRKQPPRFGDEHVYLGDVPAPPRPLHADQDTWRCYLAGIGGMGIGLCTAILTTAGHEMGYRVRFLDKKGLAIRNGGVFSQVLYTRQPPTSAAPANGQANGGDAPQTNDAHAATTPLIPYGKADLLLGIDPLEAARALDPRLPYRVASPERTAAVINTAKSPTILTLMGRDDFDPAQLERTISQYTKPDHCFGFNVSALCERVLDSKLYANIMMLGIAYQKGYLPLTPEAIETAIRTVIRRDVDRNIRAFTIGRKIAVRPDLFVVEPQHQYETSIRAYRRKVNTIRMRMPGRRGRVLAKRFRVLMKQMARATRGMTLPDSLMRDVVIRAYDCLVWGGFEYAKRYCDRLTAVFHKDAAEYDYAITKAVVRNLAKVMLVKDEIYVAALLTSPDKYRRDRRRHNVNPAHGDRILYRHYTRPEFSLLGRSFRLPMIKARDWQLRLLAQMKFLRKFIIRHEREHAFRHWYEKLVDQIACQTPREYQRWLSILGSVDLVNGYREIRYPKMTAAQRRADELLATPPEQFEPAPTRLIPPAPTPRRRATDRQPALTGTRGT